MHMIHYYIEAEKNGCHIATCILIQISLFIHMGETRQNILWSKFVVHPPIFSVIDIYLSSVGTEIDMGPKTYHRVAGYTGHW